MSSTQFKEKTHNSKTSRYYGRQRCGHSGCSELTRDESVTLQRLQAFTPGDFEAYSARGEEFRRRLCGAVLNALPFSNLWLTDCECKGEWGGVFPVHLRLTHRTNRRVMIDILSRGANCLSGTG